MRAPQMFGGIMRLAARAGYKIGADGKPAENATETDRDDEPENDGETEGDEAGGDAEKKPDPAPKDPAGPPAEGEDDGTDEESGDGEDDDSGTGGDEDGGDAGQQAGNQSPRRSADFRAGERYGAQQTAGRWAAVLASPVARGNLEMATDLLASSNMSPAAIVEHCDRYKGESSAKRLLDTTRKVNLGVEGGSQADPAAGSRKASVERANKSAAKQGASAGAPVRRSRRAAAADTSNKGK